MYNLKSFLKKITATALAALMILSFGASIMAKSFDDIDTKHQYVEQIDILSDIGVIVGTSDKEFSPDENVTREQMAMFLFRIMLGRKNPGIINTTAFEDLYDETYHGAISWANASNYIIGTTDKTFEPTGGITLQDAMTMIVRALGQATNTMDKGYPWTYIDAAIKQGLDKGLEKVNYEDTLTRAQTAAILYNALTSEYLIQKTANNGSTYVEKTTIIEYVFNYTITEGIIASTNTYSINNLPLVVKDGYVTIAYDSTKTMTVNFNDLGVEGTANEWLGRQIKLIYKADTNNNTIDVLGSTTKGEVKTFESVTVADNNSYITVDDVKYNVVEKLSDSLATNDNELLVYAYDNTGKLVQVINNANLRNYLGIYEMKMIYDDADSKVANRAIIKAYKFAQLEISEEKINIADNLKASDLIGGFNNEVQAVSGNYVLYYYNKGNKSLEIKEILNPTNNILVSKLTSNVATIGGQDYRIGTTAMGINPDNVKASLTVGRYISIVEKNGTILAVHNAAVVKVDSQYLVTTTNSLPVYTNGQLQYIVSAYINGQKTDIVMNTSGISAGNVYRYTVDANNVYTLYALSSANFVQSDEFTSVVSDASKTTLDKGILPYYTYNNVAFVTDSNTIIEVKNGANYEHKKGVYSSTIEIREDAEVIAIFKNNAGNVKTLLYMYISDGSLGVIDSLSQNVRVLAKTGSEYIDGIVYTSYEVFNYNTGAREVRYSLSGDLKANASYALDYKGNIVNVAPTQNVISGLVTGYTNGTISVNGNVYKLASDVKIIKINSDLTLTNTTLANTYLRKVEFTVVGTEVKSIIVGETLSFNPIYNEAGKILAIVANENYSDFNTADVKLTGLYRDGVKLDETTWPIYKGTYVNNNALFIDLYHIEAGTYTINFTFNTADYTVTITLPEITPAA